MFFLNPIVMSNKIQHNNSLLKAKSFTASVILHATLLVTTLYFAAHHPILLPKEEPIMISLTDYAPASTVSLRPSISKTKLTDPLLKSINPISKPLPATPQPLPVRPSVAPLDLKPKLDDSPHSNYQVASNDSPKITPSVLNNELPKSSNDEFNGATLGRIRAMIEDALTYPSIARKLGLEGVVVVSFILKQDGYVEKAEILTTSGSTLLDSKAIQTVLSLSGDYPPLNKTVYLKIPIAFSLKKA